jgi:hypothetical protein
MQGDDLFQDLKVVFSILATGLDLGTRATQDLHRANKREIDWVFAPCHVRHEVQHYLDKHRDIVENLIKEIVPNNGISLRFNGHHIRVWKTVDLAVPLSGASRRTMAFLRQEKLAMKGYFQPLLEDCITENPKNLVVLWEVDEQYGLKNLYLACPREATGDTVPDEWEWIRPIPKHLWSLPVEGNLHINDLDLPFKSIDEAGDDREEEAGS